MSTKLTFPGYGTVTYTAEGGRVVAQISSDKLAGALCRYQDNGRALDKAKRWVGRIYDCAPPCDEGFDLVDRAGEPFRHA